MCRLVFILIAILPLCWPVAAGAQGNRAVHVRVSGAIDCRRMVEEFAGEMAAARSAGAGLVIVELDGRASRPDLVWLLARHIREAGVPIAVFLNSAPGGSVGAGQAVLGTVASMCYTGPRTAIAEGGGEDLRWLAAADTDWERVEREVRGLVWSALEERGGDPQLAEVLAWPHKQGWAVEREDGLAVATAAPEAEEGQPAPSSAQFAFAGVDGFERLQIDAVLALRLKIVTGAASAVGQIAREAGVLPPMGSPRRISSGLSAARQQTEETVQSIGVLLQRIGLELDLKKRLKRTIVVQDYREAGSKALEMIAAADASLAAIEQRVEAYPELMAVRPQPGRSTRSTADTLAGKLQSLRRERDKLRITAQEHATRERN